ncbi:hypothetical protein, partial [Klebsiella pneumoniae]|uniref:hypothetical protein n=1 Tax=Klebsiella pneumoniae TaxID=573 RepID=UPI003EBFC16F
KAKRGLAAGGAGRVTIGDACLGTKPPSLHSILFSLAASRSVSQPVSQSVEVSQKLVRGVPASATVRTTATATAAAAADRLEAASDNGLDLVSGEITRQI